MEMKLIEVEDCYQNQIDQLRKLIKSVKKFDSAIQLALDIHAVTHTQFVSNCESPTFYDTLLDGLREDDFHVMPTEKDETIAWQIWHIARIEDLVGNVLIAEQPQILNEEWLKALNIHVKDTGNAMSDEQIMDFSRRIDTCELIHYRNAVGCQTRAILKALTAHDLKRKPSEDALDRLIREGGLLEETDSIWLLKFWGKHTVAGLILLPLTRHHLMHLSDSYAIKQFIKDRGIPYLI